MKCFMCSRNCNYGEHVMICRYHDGTAAPLYYHINCFYEIAGSEFEAYFGNISELNEIEKAFADAGEKINAIKSLRTRTGLGLKDSKDIVDKYLYGKDKT